MNFEFYSETINKQLQLEYHLVSQMYNLRDLDDDVEDESEMDDVEMAPSRSRNSRNQFDDITSIDNELDDRRRKKLILEEAQRKEDEEYEGEWGYSLVKALRGRTVGRRLRRKLFKFGVIEILCGFPLSILAYLESKNFQNTAQFDTEKFGSSLIVSAFVLFLLICLRCFDLSN